MNNVILLLGGNLGDVVANFLEVKNKIIQSVGNINQESEIYKSPAWGYESENIFFNQALNISTDLSVYDLLEITQNIEFSFGRTKSQEGVYKDRLIDIDIIFYNSEIINDDKITIPHKRMQERSFVLVPLCDIIPEFIHPVLKTSVYSLSKKVKNINIFKHAL